MVLKNLFLILIIWIFLVYSCSSPKPETPNSKHETKPDKNDYYENGNIRIEKIINGNEEHWIFKQEDGGCWEEKFFKDGEEYKRIVYNSNCTKSAEYELKDGKRHGEWISYNENGTIREKGQYKDGIATGFFKYYSENGNLESKVQNFIFDSLKTEFFVYKSDYNSLKEKLKNLPGFREDINIEVAGKKEFEFPELYWGNSILYFDLKDKNDNPICRSGVLRDGQLSLFGKIIIPNSTSTLQLTMLGINAEKGLNGINFYDLKLNKYYQLKIENEKVTEVQFGTIETKN